MMSLKCMSADLKEQDTTAIFCLAVYLALLSRLSLGLLSSSHNRSYSQEEQQTETSALETLGRERGCFIEQHLSLSFSLSQTIAVNRSRIHCCRVSLAH